MTINQPDIIFSDWILWHQRDNLSELGYPGVYLLAHFETAPSQVDLQAQEIVYIGETSANLKQRLNQFKADNHSGGITYRKQYGKRFDDLYVSMFPVALPKDTAPFFIRYVERKLLWDYILRWGQPPSCNRK